MLLYDKIKLMGCCLLVVLSAGCNKLVKVPEPRNSITTEEVFRNEANATAALTAIYSNMGRASNLSYATGRISLWCDISSDELNLLFASDEDLDFQRNTLHAANGTINRSFWQAIYSDIYKTNAVLEGLEGSKTLSAGTKQQLGAEARFLRAFCYFYLVNLFGDVPLVTSTDFATGSLLGRAPVSQVYQLIENDLIIAQAALPDDYEISGGQRIRANKSAATAMLARVYLFMGKAADAGTQATAVIDKSQMYTLVADLNQAFIMNNTEAIWQLKTYNDDPWATAEGNYVVPYDSTSNPTFILTDGLLAAFEPGDLRRSSWVSQTNYGGTIYYYPFKFKVRQGTPDHITEYVTPLRLAEQYLIRAEARVIGNDLAGAIADLNVIRHRAGLADLPATLTATQVTAAIAQERRVELFAEWGHRWLDLKRTGTADAVLAPIKTQWKTTAQLFPIPYVELVTAPNLKQNPGY